MMKTIRSCLEKVFGRETIGTRKRYETESARSKPYRPIRFS